MYANLRSLLSTAEAIILWKDLARIRRGQATMAELSWSCPSPGSFLLWAVPLLSWNLLYVL